MGVAAVSLMPQIIRGGDSNAMRLTPAREIEAKVRESRPLLGCKIPADLASRFGTTHYDGHYHLTNKPFIVEGAEKMHELGMRVAKFWLHEANLAGYGYNSRLSAAIGKRMVDVLRHEEYMAALAMPFSTVMLEVFPLLGAKNSFFEGESTFADEEEQFYEVTLHLLKTYAKREVTFILQNWEGDWMLRRSEGGTWGNVPEAEVQRRCEAFAQWLAARQRGVERARKEVERSRCRVFHAAEVNKVWEGAKGVATVMTHVLPQVSVDLVSWSCYDGLSSPVALWQGIELLRHYMRPSPTFGKNAVYIGEVGKPENLGATENELTEFWDWFTGTAFALKLPWFVHWELYCNEPKDGTKWDRRPRKAEELRGFWLVKPDGSLSHSGKYFTSLLQHAGDRLPKAQLRQSSQK